MFVSYSLINKPLFEVVVSFSLKHVMIISRGHMQPVEFAPIASISAGCTFKTHTSLSPLLSYHVFLIVSDWSDAICECMRV